MEPKKTDKADLEGKKTLFFQIGIVVTLALLLIAFEWTTREVNTANLGELLDVVLEEEIIPVTRHEELIEPPPPPPQPSELLNIVDNEVDIIDELYIEDVEATANTRIEITQFSMPTEEVSDEPILFFLIEDKPEFMGGGQEAFRDWVLSNLSYPQIAAENGIQGTVHLKFVVNRDGSVSDVAIVRGVDPSLDREAIRVISNSPRWEPGKQRGNPVRVAFSFPVTFRLN
ncbi:MAG: energy transducer TonB [Bacteroidales bacterium]